MDIYETWYGLSAHGPLQVLLFFSQIRPGADPGRGKNRSQGVPLFNELFSDRKATGTNRMQSNFIVMKYYYFWFHSEVKFLTRFRHLFGVIVNLSYFNAMSVDFMQ